MVQKYIFRVTCLIILSSGASLFAEQTLVVCSGTEKKNPCREIGFQDNTWRGAATSTLENYCAAMAAVKANGMTYLSSKNNGCSITNEGLTSCVCAFDLQK